MSLKARRFSHTLSSRLARPPQLLSPLLAPSGYADPNANAAGPDAVFSDSEIEAAREKQFVADLDNRWQVFSGAAGDDGPTAASPVAAAAAAASPAAQR